MKTLVVLSALAALTVGAPTNPDSAVPQLQVNGLPVSSTPEQKSARPEDLTPVSNDALLSVHETHPEARTIGLKKKVFHHKLHHKLFRDSSEEKSDSKECKKEVKVKYCEEEDATHPSDITGTATVAAAEPVSGTEVQHSIQKAQEAVENIQKMARNNAKSANDAELHEDIEKARKALSNIQQNIEKLESLELRVATLGKAEALVAANADTKLEKERMAQWKEALEKAQKSAEITGHDSLKSFVQDTDSSKKSKSANLIAELDSEKPVQAKASEPTSLNIKHTTSEDMTSAASEPIAASEPKMSVMEQNKKSSNKEKPLLLLAEQIQEQSKKSKSSELDVTLDDNSKSKSTFEKSTTIADKAKMKSAETETITKSVPENEAVPEHVHQIKAAAENPTMFKQVESKAQEDMNKKSADKLKLEENVSKPKSVDNVMPIMKSSEKEQTFEEASIPPKKDTKDFAKMVKAAKNEIFGNFDNELTMKSADQDKDKQVNIDTSVHKAKSSETINVQHFEPSKLHAQEKISSPTMKSASPHLGFHHGVGTSNSFHSHSHQVSSHHSLGHQHHSHIGHPGIFKEADMDGAPSTLQMNMKEATEKSAIDHSKLQLHMNQKSALEKNMQEWKAKHSEAMERGAYGGYGGALPAYGAAGIGVGGNVIGVSGGAVGGAFGGGSGAGGVSAVFPGGKHSSCGIPLLLSCSPSVVSGSLKSHGSGYGASGYGSSGYRADGSNLHTKRETKKNNDIPVTKVKRNPEKNILKTSSTKIYL